MSIEEQNIPSSIRHAGIAPLTGYVDRDLMSLARSVEQRWNIPGLVTPPRSDLLGIFEEMNLRVVLFGPSMFERGRAKVGRFELRSRKPGERYPNFVTWRDASEESIWETGVRATLRLLFGNLIMRRHRAWESRLPSHCVDATAYFRSELASSIVRNRRTVVGFMLPPSHALDKQVDRGIGWKLGSGYYAASSMELALAIFMAKNYMPPRITLLADFLEKER